MNVSKGMARLQHLVFLALSVSATAACSPRIYHAPHMGAEYRFDEGMKPDKRRHHLFGKDMNRYLEERGQQQVRSAGSAPAAASPPGADSSAVAGARADSSALTSPVPAASPASNDSSGTAPR